MRGAPVCLMPGVCWSGVLPGPGVRVVAVRSVGARAAGVLRACCPSGRYRGGVPLGGALPG